MSRSDLMLIAEGMPVATPLEAFIEGEWQSAPDSEPIPVVNPSTGGQIGCFNATSIAQTDRAIRSASATFDAVREAKPRVREKWLRALAETLEENTEFLAKLTTRDMGMPYSLAVMQVRAAAEYCNDVAGWATKLTGVVAYPSNPGDFHAYVAREPLGVVGAIVPWNAPLLLTMLKLAPAIATGNTIVIKPSEEATLPLLGLAALVRELDIPPGAISVVPGLGPTVGARIASHPSVGMVSVTGSVGTGQSVLRASIDTLKKITLELGGKSANIVMPDADLDFAVPDAGWGVFAYSGQICVGGSRILVHRSIYEEFCDRLAKYAMQLRVGDGFDADTQLGPLVSARQRDKVIAMSELAESQGARPVATGRINPDAAAEGFFFAPRVFADVRNDSDLGRNEVFGPVAAVMPFDTLDEAISLANDSPFGLASGLYTRDVSTVHQTARLLRAGVVWVNGYFSSDPGMPFGGVKLSGLGREKSHQVLDEYTESKSVWIRL